MAFWTCPVEGFEAQNEEEKRQHLQQNAGDQRHQQQMGQKGGVGEDVAEDTGDKVEDVTDKIS